MNLKKIIGIPWFMGIKDKIELNDKLICPPHYTPHSFYPYEKITNEKCHIHKKSWRMAHHKIFCWLFCKQNYKTMINKHEEYSKRS